MSSVSEPKYGLPRGYTALLHHDSMRVEPAARAAIVLASAANINLLQHNPFKPAYLYNLRGHALSCVRSALADPVRRDSDAVIVAVSSITVSELFFGRREDYEAHLRGLTHLRKSRGETLGKFLDGVLSSICDITMSKIDDWVSDAYR